LGQARALFIIICCCSLTEKFWEPSLGIAGMWLYGCFSHVVLGLDATFCTWAEIGINTDLPFNASSTFVRIFEIFNLLFYLLKTLSSPFLLGWFHIWTKTQFIWILRVLTSSTNSRFWISKENYIKKLVMNFAYPKAKR
jgi:hypothetical protein